MGWNCFQGEDNENPTGPKTIGETLRQKFPRLYSLIERVKEKGAPSRIKKRFRRRHRILPDNSPNISNKVQKQTQTNERTVESPGKCSCDSQCKMHQTDSCAPKAIVGTSEKNSHGSMQIIEKTPPPMEEELEDMAEAIVSDVLGKICETESPHIFSSSESLNKVVDDLVEETLSKAVSSASLDSPVKLILVKEYDEGQKDKPEESNGSNDRGKGDVPYDGDDNKTETNDETDRKTSTDHVLALRIKTGDGEDTRGESGSNHPVHRPTNGIYPVVQRAHGAFDYTIPVLRPSDGIYRAVNRAHNKLDSPYYRSFCPLRDQYNRYCFPKSDHSLRRILGKDDLLKLGLEISRRNARLPTRHS